jgi:dGTPase
MVTAPHIAAHVPAFATLYETVETQFPGATDRERFHETLRRLIDFLVSGLIESTVTRAREAGARSVEDVRDYRSRLASFTEEAKSANRDLKRYLHAEVYSSPVVCQERARSTAMMAELFTFFVDHPERLPSSYREMAEEEAPHRVACDYIAGMTDAFFRRTYSSIFAKFESSHDRTP